MVELNRQYGEEKNIKQIYEKHNNTMKCDSNNSNIIFDNVRSDFTWYT